LLQTRALFKKLEVLIKVGGPQLLTDGQLHLMH
jgi:hypothetical protein